MSLFKPDTSLLDLLARVDTPTVCNAIEVAQGQRGFASFTRKQPLACDPALPAIFGRAVTAKIRGAEPPDLPSNEVRKIRMAYYRMVAEASGPKLVVIEDEDGEKAVSAYWGEINTAIHKGFGVAGVLTNGLMRDLGDMEKGFQVLAGSVGPSHAFVHVTALAVPVNVFGISVKPGDFVHADRHGAVIVPEDILPKLTDAIEKLLSTEKIVLDAARKPGFDFQKFEEAWNAFEKSRT